MAELDRVLIASRIQRARDEAGLTQTELGDALNPPVHWRTVQTWESAKDKRVPWGRLDEIAALTGTTKEWLLHGDAATERDEELLVRLDRLDSTVAEMAELLRSHFEGQPPASEDPPGEEPAVQDQPG